MVIALPMISLERYCNIWKRHHKFIDGEYSCTYAGGDRYPISTSSLVAEDNVFDASLGCIQRIVLNWARCQEFL